MSPRPRRDQKQNSLSVLIISTAWKQIASSGAASLSLRAIARELGITAPAIYNYFPNRDALVTALIVDAFTSFGDSQIEALNGIPDHEHALRLYTLGQAYRQWALAYPERYQLIFGTPIPGYIAPAEMTQSVAARSLDPLVGVLAAAHSTRKLMTETYPQMLPRLQAMFQAWQQARGTADPYAFFLALTLWGQVHGLVSLEIGNQFPPFVTDPGEVYRQALEILTWQLFPDTK
jgi:AcrR family transcriptional regulator